ncbi:unnamed protein product [Merluccius merluccius]
MVGHSKANVAKVIGDLIRAGRTSTPPESCLSFRGDSLQVGSIYEEHKVGSPDCFDILVPLRVPSGLKLQPRVIWGAAGGEAAEKHKDQREEDADRREEETKGELKLTCSVKKMKNYKNKKEKRSKSRCDIQEDDHENAPKREYEEVDWDEGVILRTVNTIEKDISGPVPKGCLEVPLCEEWVRRHQAFANTFLRLCAQESPSGRGAKVYRFIAASVLHWFFLTMQRCLAIVRYSHEQHCRLSITLSNECVQLHLTQQPDYICCHISTVVRMVPVFLLGNGIYLVPTNTASLSEYSTKHYNWKDLWTLHFPHHEQRLLSWKRSRVPRTSCHLKCLQLVKAIRDLGGQALDSQGAETWGTVLSSYVLKTAWMRLLLRIPAEAWEERHLVARVEDLIQCLTEALEKRSIAHLFLGGERADSLASDSLVFSKLAKEDVEYSALHDAII